MSDCDMTIFGKLSKQFLLCNDQESNVTGQIFDIFDSIKLLLWIYFGGMATEILNKKKNHFLMYVNKKNPGRFRL